MSIINEWSPFPKNKDWRKKGQEKPKTAPNPNPHDDKKGWGTKTNKEKEGDWYQNESRNMNEDKWKDAYRTSDGKIIQYSRPYQSSKNKNFRTINAPQPKPSNAYNDFDEGWRDEYADKNGKTIAQSRMNPTTKKREFRIPKNESVVPKKLIRLTESDLHRIIKESVNRILNEDWADDLCARLKNAPGTVRNPYPPKTETYDDAPLNDDERKLWDDASSFNTKLLNRQYISKARKAGIPIADYLRQIGRNYLADRVFGNGAL